MSICHYTFNQTLHAEFDSLIFQITHIYNLLVKVSNRFGTHVYFVHLKHSARCPLPSTVSFDSSSSSPTVHKPNTRSDYYLFRVFPSSLSFIFFKAIRGNPFMMNSSNPAYQNLLRIEKKVETDTNKSTI